MSHLKTRMDGGMCSLLKFKDPEEVFLIISNSINNFSFKNISIPHCFRIVCVIFIDDHIFATYLRWKEREDYSIFPKRLKYSIKEFAIPHSIWLIKNSFQNKETCKRAALFHNVLRLSPFKPISSPAQTYL